MSPDGAWGRAPFREGRRGSYNVMPESQDLVALCGMLPPEVLEIIRKKVYERKAQDRCDIGWKPILECIKRLDKNWCYKHFLETGWAVTGGNMKDFLEWQVENIWDCAVDYACESRRPLHCEGYGVYTITCRCY